MPRVTILSRDPLVRAPTAVSATVEVSVGYQTTFLPPATVALPMDLYREATAEELAGQPRYKVVPKDDESALAEQLAIQQDFDRRRQSPPHSFELP